MSACRPCTAALTNPYAGEFVDGCIGCSVRYTSQQPRARRDLIFAAITDPEARFRFHADCLAEYRRRQELLANRNVQ